MEGTDLLMVDYADPINSLDYKYKRTISYVNNDNYIKNNVVVKLYLSGDNFNFDLAKEDGSDFRLVLFGGTLKMWKAYWSKDTKRAALFFIIPHMPAARKVSLIAYWGNETAEDISEPDALGFYFTESFDSVPLDSSKWSGRTTNSLTSYGYYVYYYSYPFTTVTNPLEGLHSFKLECGIYCDWDPDASWPGSYYAIAMTFTGTENDFMVGISNDRGITTAVDSSTDYNTGTHHGLEGYSYNDVTVGYNEDSDRVVVNLRNRKTYSDVEYSWGRKVEGDTRPKNISITGYYSYSSNPAAHPTYINWLAIRDFDAADIDILDASNLFIEHEYVAHQVIDTKAYGTDITSVLFRHESSFGGNPLLLSEGGYDADTNVWISNDEATTQEYVALTIDTAWSEDVSDVKYTHYDSGHVYYYNASKLSDNGVSTNDRTYLKLTTTSGWAAIKFSQVRCLGAVRVKPTSNLEAAPKDFKFYGSNFNPNINYTKAELLAQGTLDQVEEWQSIILYSTQSYRYFILEILNTHGGQNVEIQEWELMDYIKDRELRYVTQLRLHPAIYSNLEYNFPKQISLLATADGYTWDTLIPWIDTYTPFISHYPEYGFWQRYSFENIKGYWSFKLLCKGNWLATDGRMAIGEWSLHELESEAYTYRVLDGITNNIQQIWASPDYDFEDEHSLFYITNEKLSIVNNSGRISSHELPINYTDINVMQETD